MASAEKLGSLPLMNNERMFKYFKNLRFVVPVPAYGQNTHLMGYYSYTIGKIWKIFQKKAFVGDAVNCTLIVHIEEVRFTWRYYFFSYRLNDKNETNRMLTRKH